MHKVFISYHHLLDQEYKTCLVEFAKKYNIFIDRSVNTGDIDENLPSQTIRRIIRDNYLQDSTVTIVLIGTETKGRKHIDWELYSSMINGQKNKKSGILAITLPGTNCGYYQVAHDDEKEAVYPKEESWITIESRAKYEQRFPYLTKRLIDNLIKPQAKISVTNWDKINVETLRFLVEAVHNDRFQCEYDLSRPMRRANA